jgi:hypothetical protein
MLDFFSKILNFMSYLFTLYSVLYKETINIDSFLNNKWIKNFNCVSLFKFKAIQLHAEYLWEFYYPIRFLCFGNFTFWCFVIFDNIMIHIFPSFILILCSNNIHHDLSKSLNNLLTFLVTTFILVVNDWF